MSYMYNITEKIKGALIRRIEPFGEISYSQEGEDILLNKYLAALKPLENIHYIDIGAHHPKRFSNTYFFYRRGGCGINIDAMPGSMKLFKKTRSRDINLEIGIATENASKTYFSFNEPAVNTFDKHLADIRCKQGYYLDRKYSIPTKPLSKILDEHCKWPENIDFMSIDTEGYEMEVLQSNDWKTYRPIFIIIEVLEVEYIEDLAKSDVLKFIENKGYKLISRLFNSLVFVEKTCKKFSEQ